MISWGAKEGVGPGMGWPYRKLRLCERLRDQLSSLYCDLGLSSPLENDIWLSLCCLPSKPSSLSSCTRWVEREMEMLLKL